MPLFVPTSVDPVQLLEAFKKTGSHLGLVTDDFGSLQGLVTLTDLMEAVVGDLPEPGDRRLPDATQRDYGSWLVDGSMVVAEFRSRFALPPLPGEEEEFCGAVGGFMLDRFGHIPKAGEHFLWNGWRFEVVDMDRHRVDKVLVDKPTNPPSTPK